ncbi:MAG: phage holin family protein [Verrucomicrobiota bacterium]
MIQYALLRWIFLSLAVFLSSMIVPGIEGDARGILIAALTLGILNAFIKPIITIISLPFIILTLGLFILIINALLLMLTGFLVPGFQIAGFWSALGGSLIISLVGMFFGVDKKTQDVKKKTVKKSFHVRQPPRERRPKPPPGKGPVIDV